MIDLDPIEDVGKDAASIATSVVAGAAEPETAFRGNTRYVARLVRERRISFRAVPITFRADATYLISGGLGGIGLRVARWMVDRGGRHLVLVARGAPGDEARRVKRELEMAGARIDICLLDVADEAAVRAIIHEFAPTLRGIMHAAGTFEDAIIRNQDWPHFERVFRPKVRGAWNLHISTLDVPLDHFTLFGSAASVLGSPGQANYAAANAFLEALARYRRGTGRPAMCINWGAWASVGMANTFTEGRDAAETRSLTPQVALDILESAMQCELAQVTALSSNGPR